MTARIVDILEIVDILNWRAKDEAREHYADSVTGVVLFHVFPDSQFAKLLSRAVADVRVIDFAGIFECNLTGISV